LVGKNFVPDPSVRERKGGFCGRHLLSFVINIDSKIPELGMEYGNSGKGETAEPSYDH
jgi:hypothetical protein